MTANIYDQHRAAFAKVSAYCVVDKKGERVAAYVHVFGGPMTRGFAGGGGYDRASAAVLHAVEKIDPAKYGERKDFAVYVDAAENFKRLVDSGRGWDDQLRDLGYQVFQAV